MLKTETDYPSKHPELGNKMPILDLAVWVEEMQLPAPGLEDSNLDSNCKDVCLPLGMPKQDVQGLDDGNKPATRMVQQINYQFFSKPIAPKRKFLASSAQPWSQKRTTFTQEIIRRLLRTRKEQSCKNKQRILSEYCQVLKNSGYSVQMRREVLDSGLKGYNKILDEHNNGTKPM